MSAQPPAELVTIPAANTRTSSGVETKVAAGSAAGIVTGILSWALVTFVPSFKGGIPADLQPFIPWAAAWLVGTAAGYLAPHTHRAELAPQPAVVEVAPAMVEMQPGQVVQVPGPAPGSAAPAPAHQQAAPPAVAAATVADPPTVTAPPHPRRHRAGT